MPSSLNTWSRALQIALGLLAAGVSVVAGWGLMLIILDQGRQGEDWDGLGTFLGLIIGGLAMIALALLTALLLLVRTGRRQGSPARLATAATISLAAAVAVLASLLWMAATRSIELGPGMVLLVGLPATGLAVPAAGALVEARRVKRLASGPAA